MRKLCVAGFVLVSAFAEAKEPVKFIGKDWTVDLSINVVARVSAVTGKTWLYIDLDDERDASFGMQLEVVLHASIGEKEYKIPLDMNDYQRTVRRTYNKELGAGPIGRVFLELERGYGTGTCTREAYSGPVFADAGCIRDYLRAKRMDGVAARELMNEVVATGCLRMADRDTAEVINDKSPAIAGMRKARLSSGVGYIIPSQIKTLTFSNPTQIAIETLPIHSVDLTVTPGPVKTDN